MGERMTMLAGCRHLDVMIFQLMWLHWRTLDLLSDRTLKSFWDNIHSSCSAMMELKMLFTDSVVLRQHSGYEMEGLK